MTERSWCNACNCETEHDKDGCVYHQRITYSEDGEVSFRYDEFNQDGEEW